jgi:hypothetical protein
MNRSLPIAICIAMLASGWSPSLTIGQGPTAAPVPAVSPEATAQMVAKLIADAIPREYERKKDWGKTKEIVTGVRSSGNFFKFDIHRTRSVVNDGVWKHYRATMVEPEKNLVVRIENLRSVAAGKIAFTSFVTTKLNGWGRAKVYERGVHLIALEAETDAKVNLWLDCEIALEAAPSSFFTGIAVRPTVTAARMSLDEFRLTRVSDVSGPIVRELGDGIRHLIEDELNGPKLAGKINRSIEKRKDRLVFTPEMLVGAAGTPGAAGMSGASSAAK